MDAVLQHHARQAIARLQHALNQGPDVEHRDIRAATLSVFAFRNRTIEMHQKGAISDRCLRQANALASLAYGAEFPLSGLHRHRLEQARDGMRNLLLEETCCPNSSSR